MSIRIYRPLAASALLAGSLCLLASTAGAAPAARPARPAAAGPSVFSASLDSAWLRLLHLFAGDHDGQAGSAGDASDASNASGDHHGGHHPDTDEGPGMCPHGH